MLKIQMNIITTENDGIFLLKSWGKPISFKAYYLGQIKGKFIHSKIILTVLLRFYNIYYEDMHTQICSIPRDI